MAKKKLYQILSPDGFDISMEKTEYKLSETKKALTEFASRYTKQGHYSSAKHGRIHHLDIIKYCEVILID